MHNCFSGPYKDPLREHPKDKIVFIDIDIFNPTLCSKLEFTLTFNPMLG